MQLYNFLIRYTGVFILYVTRILPVRPWELFNKGENTLQVRNDNFKTYCIPATSHWHCKELTKNKTLQIFEI